MSGGKNSPGVETCRKRGILVCLRLDFALYSAARPPHQEAVQTSWGERAMVIVRQENPARAFESALKAGPAKEGRCARFVIGGGVLEHCTP